MGHPARYFQLAVRNLFCPDPKIIIKTHYLYISQTLTNMKNINTTFLIIGLSIISTAQIILHFIKLSDFASGSIIGIGIGLLIMSFIAPRKNHNRA